MYTIYKVLFWLVFLCCQRGVWQHRDMAYWIQTEKIMEQNERDNSSPLKLNVWRPKVEQKQLKTYMTREDLRIIANLPVISKPKNSLVNQNLLALWRKCAHHQFSNINFACSNLYTCFAFYFLLKKTHKKQCRIFLIHYDLLYNYSIIHRPILLANEWAFLLIR